ncbi:uncharacterized protein BcabD6B2_33860 [Babesia caballi]|uniref:Uncharacterized protein n=1 Tax=Babesia caballi TaxID=5871 RepID=A0AAV4LVT1_BABCB|nr:hypothetical protein, conserved [Babesia caballi]
MPSGRSSQTFVRHLRRPGLLLHRVVALCLCVAAVLRVCGIPVAAALHPSSAIRRAFRSAQPCPSSLTATPSPAAAADTRQNVPRRRSVITELSRQHVQGFVNRLPLRACGGKAPHTRSHRVHSLDEEDNHRLLKELALNKDQHFDASLGRDCSLYRYFNITRSNVEDHLRSTMDEHFAAQSAKAARSVYVVDGGAFNGDYTNWRLPIPRSMTSYEFEGVHPDAQQPLSEHAAEVRPRFADAMLSSIYDVVSAPDSPGCASSTEALIALYDEVGDCEYFDSRRGKVIKKDYLGDVDVVSSEDVKREREMLHNVLSHPTTFPSYIDPDNPAHRTGRGRELQRRHDSGRLQRLRWKMDIDPADDILRGHRETGNSVTKEFVDSIEWEQPMPTYHDRNFFKRTFAEGGFGEADRTSDSYFDIQFIGSPDAYPHAVSAGMQFAWPIYWVPLLAKKHPKRHGQPLRSPVFNLGGVEPLQLWFYPEGSAASSAGFCSLKLVSPPGWCLPYRIYLFVCSEYNRVVLGPLYRESPDYVRRSVNFCRYARPPPLLTGPRLLDKRDKELVRARENDRDYVILGPAGNVYVGVGVVDECVRSRPGAHGFAYDWDEGAHDFNQWLKKQTADPDDEFQQETVDRERTHSVWYESHKYKYVPDRHLSRYWRSRYSKELDWRQPTF